MKKYIKSSIDYIGGKLYDVVDKYGYFDDSDEAEDVHTKRAEAMDQYILDFADWYIFTNPKYDNFELIQIDDYAIRDLWEGLAIKDGVDLIAYPDHLEAVGYYNGYKDIVCLYPVSDTKAGELTELIENGDFDESTIIENEIAQETWNGASAEDVLKSWK